MTPDSFFKVNPNIQPGAIAHTDRDSRRVRPSSQPDGTGKDFKKILSRKERNEDEEDHTERSSLEDELLKDVEEKEAVAQKKQQPKSTTLDPDFNQIPTMAKESKVAPKLGSEKKIAPSEEPWASPFIEGSKKEELLKSQKKSTDFASTQEAAIHSPAELFGRMAQAKATTLKKIQLAEEIKQSLPLIDDLEISGSSKKGFFSLVPEKPLDQDLASINLFVLAIGPSDNLVYAEKLLPPRDISAEILKLCEQITNNMNADLTKTTIVLKNSGIFDGVEVTVTSFKTAHGEINIQFSNLTQATKDLLDVNLDALKQALDQKGYTVHMIATTTVRDEVIAGEPEKKEREDSKDGQNPQGQKKEENTGDEEIA